MIKIDKAVIVEGKYDKMRLEKVCDCPIFTTEGFRIFKDKEKREFLKKLASARGILILTDSDRAGFMIRNHIKGFVDEGSVINAYIPEIFGKEKRKSTPSKEGKLGVEGLDEEVLLKVLSSYASQKEQSEKITKNDLFELGLYGGAKSKEMRTTLCKKLSVPVGISVNSLIDAINALITRDEFYKMMGF